MGILYINFINTRISVTGSSIVVYNNNITIIIGLEPGAVIVLIFTILLFIIPARLCGRARMKSLGPTVLHYWS